MLNTITPKLSALMTNYNHGRYIAEALDAIVNQSYKPFEVIVCDDGSTDNSVEIIQGFVDKYKFVRLIRNKVNLGIFVSSDKLTSMVSGDYLYYASADDRILPGFFEKSMNLLRQYPQAGLCSALSFVMNRYGKNRTLSLLPVVSLKSCYFPPDKVREIFLKRGCWIFGLTAILRFDYFKQEGCCRPELYSFSDCFIDHVLALKYGACFIPKPLTSWRRTEGTYSDKIVNSPKLYKDLIENTALLMQTNYSNIFPDGYSEKWKKLHYFYLNANVSKKNHNERLAKLTALPIFHGWAGKPLLACLRFLINVKIFLTKLYLFFSFKGNIWQLITQRAFFYFYKNFYR